MCKRGQGTFEYILLLGGALLVTTISLFVLTQSQPQIDLSKQCAIAARQNLECFGSGGVFSESKSFKFQGMDTACSCTGLSGTGSPTATIVPEPQGAADTPSPNPQSNPALQPSPAVTPVVTPLATPDGSPAADPVGSVSPSPQVSPSPSPQSSPSPSPEALPAPNPADTSPGASPSPSPQVASPSPSPSPGVSSPTPVPASWAYCQKTDIYVPIVPYIGGFSNPTRQIFSGAYDLPESTIPAGAWITSIYMAPRDQGDRDAGGCPNAYINGQKVSSGTCTLCTDPSGGNYCGDYGFAFFAGPIDYPSPGIQMPLRFSGTVSSATTAASLHAYVRISYRAPACG